MIDFIYEVWNSIIYEYGSCTVDGKRRLARRNRLLGNVQFILWQPGEHGHVHPYWVDYDRTWWKNFKKEDIGDMYG